MVHCIHILQHSTENKVIQKIHKIWTLSDAWRTNFKKQDLWHVYFFTRVHKKVLLITSLLIVHWAQMDPHGNMEAATWSYKWSDNRWRHKLYHNPSTCCTCEALFHGLLKATAQQTKKTNDTSCVSRFNANVASAFTP